MQVQNKAGPAAEGRWLQEWEWGAGNGEQGAGSREWGAGSRAQGSHLTLQH